MQRRAKKRELARKSWKEGANQKHGLARANGVPDLPLPTRSHARKPPVDIAKGHFAALQKNYLAMRDRGSYIRPVRRFPLYILGRFLPKLGGVFGHRPFF
jgi:hypothetical protein